MQKIMKCRRIIPGINVKAAFIPEELFALKEPVVALRANDAYADIETAFEQDIGIIRMLAPHCKRIVLAKRNGKPTWFLDGLQAVAESKKKPEMAYVDAFRIASEDDAPPKTLTVKQPTNDRVQLNVHFRLTSTDKTRIKGLADAFPGAHITVWEDAEVQLYHADAIVTAKEAASFTRECGIKEVACMLHSDLLSKTVAKQKMTVRFQKGTSPQVMFTILKRMCRMPDVASPSPSSFFLRGGSAVVKAAMITEELVTKFKDHEQVKGCYPHVPLPKKYPGLKPFNRDVATAADGMPVDTPAARTRATR
jgi:hypothetical protein